MAGKIEENVFSGGICILFQEYADIIFWSPRNDNETREFKKKEKPARSGRGRIVLLGKTTDRRPSRPPTDQRSTPYCFIRAYSLARDRPDRAQARWILPSATRKSSDR